MREMAELEELWSAASPSNGCIICGRVGQDGMRVFGQLICHACEREIVQTDVEDEAYRRYVEQMKLIWLSALSL
ncbi:sigma factor G inhibitor Gin [Alicyclobacillus sendaiensis]|uniref:Sigma factor G inhibitor Gin n=1 Tax=Alicyclobacillus sendaiensis PA2 TaxID=3029425 RepID=A0ABT6XZ89_ALISE|nr:sigma factor G inhibitor Gin [Alicyclobacillus sendaiensis]MDI9260408.1 sigma factor G inhibitor Gin [Alicyclobacillus sendaiensis PA2]